VLTPLGVLEYMAVEPDIESPAYSSIYPVSYTVNSVTSVQYVPPTSTSTSTSRTFTEFLLGNITYNTVINGYKYKAYTQVGTSVLPLPPVYPELSINVSLIPNTTLSVTTTPSYSLADLILSTYVGYSVSPNDTYIVPARFSSVLSIGTTKYILPIVPTIYPYALLTPPFAMEIGRYSPEALFVLADKYYPAYTGEYGENLRYIMSTPFIDTVNYAVTYNATLPGGLIQINVTATLSRATDIFGTPYVSNMQYLGNNTYLGTTYLNTTYVTDEYSKIPYVFGIPFTEFYPSSDNEIYPYISSVNPVIRGVTVATLVGDPTVSFLDTSSGKVVFSVTPNLPYLGFNQTLYVAVVRGLNNYYAVLLSLNYTTYYLLSKVPVYTVIAYNLTDGTILSQGAFISLLYISKIFPAGAVMYPGGIELLIQPSLSLLYSTAISYYTLGIGRAIDTNGDTVEWVRLITDYDYMGATLINSTTSLLATYEDGILNVSYVAPEIVPGLLYENFVWNIDTLHSYNITSPQVENAEKAIYEYNTTAVVFAAHGVGYYILTANGMEKILDPASPLYAPWYSMRILYPSTNITDLLNPASLIKIYEMYTPYYLNQITILGIPISGTFITSKFTYHVAYYRYNGVDTYLLVSGKVYVIPGKLYPGKYLLNPSQAIIVNYPYTPPDLPASVTNLYMPSAEITPTSTNYQLTDPLYTNYYYNVTLDYKVITPTTGLLAPVTYTRIVFNPFSSVAKIGDTVVLTLANNYVYANYTYSYVYTNTTISAIPYNGTDALALYDLYYNVSGVYPSLVYGVYNNLYYPITTPYLVAINTPYGLLVTTVPVLYMNYTNTTTGILVKTTPTTGLPAEMVLFNTTPVQVLVDGVPIKVSVVNNTVVFDPLYSFIITKATPVATLPRATPTLPKATAGMIMGGKHILIT